MNVCSKRGENYRSKRKNKEVKDQILQAAKTLFSSRGFDGTTVRQICEEADVSLALVSYHFGGKENVFNALFEPLRHTFMNAHYDVQDSIGALRSFCRNFVLYRIQEHELIDILQQEIVMNSPRLEMLKDVFYLPGSNFGQFYWLVRSNRPFTSSHLMLH